MSEPQTAPKRSPAEWSYLIRRGNVLRAIRHPALTPAAKQVLVRLSLAADDPVILPERPPVMALARHLALAERTVRQAIAELVEQNCLTFRVTGEGLPPGQGAPSDPSARPDLAREWAFLSEARRPPTLEEYLDTLARLRDHAVAAKRIATAVSAERALGRALAERMRRPEKEAAPLPERICREAEEAPLGPPGEDLELVDKVTADRALAPAARHALLEVMLDRRDDPLGPEDDHHLAWSARLAGRLGLTVRGARKALAELESLGLVVRTLGPDGKEAGGDVYLHSTNVRERMRRGTDAPQRLPPGDGLDPVGAHVRRLERLRDFALAEGLASTAVSAYRAIGRALGLDGKARAKKTAAPKPAIAPPAEPAQLIQADILPTLRGIMGSDPGARAMMLEVLAEIEAETKARPPADSAFAHAAE